MLEFLGNMALGFISMLVIVYVVGLVHVLGNTNEKEQNDE